MPTFGMLFIGILLILALWWIKEMYKRWREDWSELRNPDTDITPRLVIIGMWLLTALIAFYAISVLMMIAVGIISGLHSLL